MSKTKKAVFASGCFWGTQHYLDKAEGVMKSTVGYTGGDVKNPTYEQALSGQTSHVESVEVKYNPKITSYEKLAKLFFETHDFTQTNDQGPDIGSQYQSVIFYSSDTEKKIAEKLINTLESRGMKIATRVEKLAQFCPPERYHQNYYQKTGGTPYCHIYRPLFD